MQFHFGVGRPQARPHVECDFEVLGVGVVGVDEKRLETVGYGDTKPKASNKAEKGRAVNRRIEFTVIR